MSERLRSDTPLPEAMQGRWLDDDRAPGELLVEGAVVHYRGTPLRYDWYTAETRHDALCVDFGVDDPDREDSFARENLTGLVIDPEGRFLGFNTRFGVEFRRAG